MDHKEIGYHHQKKSEALCSTVVSSWEEEREMENLPEAPDILGQMTHSGHNVLTGLCPQIYTCSGRTSWDTIT